MEELNRLQDRIKDNAKKDCITLIKFKSNIGNEKTHNNK